MLLVSDPVPSRSFDGGSCHGIANSERVSPDGFRKILYSLLEKQGLGKRRECPQDRVARRQGHLRRHAFRSLGASALKISVIFIALAPFLRGLQRVTEMSVSDSWKIHEKPSTRS